MDNLTRFRKHFFFPNSAKKWESRFLALTPLQQKAVNELLYANMFIEESFNEVEAIDNETLLLHYDETIGKLTTEWLYRSTW